MKRGTAVAAIFLASTGKRISKHGHHVNMSNPSYERVACGFAKSAEGNIWSVRNFR